jgi:hypothetical protein
MKKIVALIAVMVLLGGCETFPPKRGFMTRALLGPETTAQPSAPVSQSARFCVARGYTPGTPNFDFCRKSIDSQSR